jgi:hypothetical protein
MSFTSHGVRVGLRVNKAEALPRLLEHAPPGWRPSQCVEVDALFSAWIGQQRSTRRRDFHLLYHDGGRISRTLDFGRLLKTFESFVNVTVANLSSQFLFVHAGVVGWRDRAIVLPGRSHSGKTRLVAALVKAGATYYSDEYALVDQQGLIHPYARPLSVRREDGEFDRVMPQQLGGAIGFTPLRPALVLASRYDERATLRMRVMTSGKSLLALLDNTVAARRRPHDALRMLKPLAECRSFKVVRGEADLAVERILREAEKGV